MFILIYWFLEYQFNIQGDLPSNNDVIRLFKWNTFFNFQTFFAELIPKCITCCVKLVKDEQQYIHTFKKIIKWNYVVM